LRGRQPESDSAPPPTGSTPAGAAARETSHQLELALTNAEYLMSYAVDAGIEVEPDIAQRIIAARRLGEAIWDSPDAGALVAAITNLAAKLHPVTAETLRACREESDDAIRGYKRIVLWLASFVIPLSMISFIYSGISNSISANIKTANDLTVSLHSRLDTPAPAGAGQSAPAGSLADLRQFAVAIRAIYGHALQLNWFVLNLSYDFYHHKFDEMQITAGLPTTVSALQEETTRLTKVYQEVRLFATNVQDATAVIWGAVSTCILPVLYALLGACAYVLRSFTQQTEGANLCPLLRHTGTVYYCRDRRRGRRPVQQFHHRPGISLSPLAIAFLIGYAADIFFSFLEGSVQSLRGGKAR